MNMIHEYKTRSFAQVLSEYEIVTCKHKKMSSLETQWVSWALLSTNLIFIFETLCKRSLFGCADYLFYAKHGCSGSVVEKVGKGFTQNWALPMEEAMDMGPLSRILS